jgi:hypothetical protein
MTVAGALWLMIELPFLAIIARALNLRLLFVFTVFVYHLAVSIIYYTYLAEHTDVDTYYYGADYWRGSVIPGTHFIIALVAVLKLIAEFSIFDLFLIFQSFGLVGILFIASLLDSLRIKVDKFQIPTATMLFLPGLHFWSVAIGKDSIILLAIGMIIWSVKNVSSRWIWLAAGLCLSFMVRPHVGLVYGLALGVALLFAINQQRITILAVLTLLFSAAPFAVPIVISVLELESIGVDELLLYVEKRQSYNLEGGSSIDIREMPLWLKLFTFLFRPLFYDSANLFGFVASLENSIVLLMVIYLLVSAKRALNLFVHDMLFRFCVFSTLSVWLMLALSTANIGIALRQKWMIIPFLFVIIQMLLVERHFKRRRA